MAGASYLPSFTSNLTSTTFNHLQFDKTVDQLSAYLAHLATQGKVVFEHNQWRKPEPPKPQRAQTEN